MTTSASSPGADTLAETRERYRALVELSPDAVFVIQDGRHVFANARGLELLGARDLEELGARPAMSYLHPAVRAAAAGRLEGMVRERRELAPVEERMVTLDGRVLDIEAAGSPISFDGRPAALVVVRDITARKREAAALSAARSRFLAAFRHAPIGMAVLDRGGRLLEANPALDRMVGAAEGELLGRPVEELLLAEHREAYRHAVAALVRGTVANDSAEVQLSRLDGGWRWAHLSTSTLVEHGEVTGFVVQVVDTSSQKAEQEELIELALNDPLTGLANRLRFTDRLGVALRRGQRHPGTVGVLFLDLDGFKPVNDRLGHAAGDQVLVEVARRLREVVRPADTVARLGGDEFGIVVEDLHGDTAAVEVAERVREVIGRPMTVDGTAVTVTTSTGIAICDDPAADVDRMLSSADAAMYAAKTAAKTADGAGRWQLTRVAPLPTGSAA